MGEINKNLVYVQSIPRATATKISNWRNEGSSGRSLGKTKIGRSTDKLRALYSGRVGGLANYISYTPWKEDGKPVLDDKGKPLMLQQKYEERFNLPKGYLSNITTKRNEIPTPDKITYFQSKGWRLQDGSTVFDLSTLDGLMGYYVMLASKFVANSEKEWRSHKWPDAKWYIALHNESEEIKYNKTQRKAKAFATLLSNDMTEEARRKFCDLLGLKSSTTSLSNQQIYNLLYDYIDSSTYTPGSNIEKFNDLYNKFSTKSGRNEFNMEHLLKRATDTRTIIEKQGSYTWVRPDGVLEIGSTKKDALNFLLNPKKSALVEELLDELKVKN